MLRTLFIVLLWVVAGCAGTPEGQESEDDLSSWPAPAALRTLAPVCTPSGGGCYQGLPANDPLVVEAATALATPGAIDKRMDRAARAVVKIAAGQPIPAGEDRKAFIHTRAGRALGSALYALHRSPVGTPGRGSLRDLWAMAQSDDPRLGPIPTKARDANWLFTQLMVATFYYVVPVNP